MSPRRKGRLLDRAAAVSPAASPASGSAPAAAVGVSAHVPADPDVAAAEALVAAAEEADRRATVTLGDAEEAAVRAIRQRTATMRALTDAKRRLTKALAAHNVVLKAQEAALRRETALVKQALASPITGEA